MMNKTIPVVLAVDDTPENLDILVDYLSDQYRVKVATNGERALELAMKGPPPDLILLDIMMPGIDGLEVCRRLKEHTDLKDVPVIFLSALEDVNNKVNAFTSGGADYVTKPFEPEELLARISTHLTLRKLHQQLENHNNRLDELVHEKSKELAEAHDRLLLINQTKGEFLKLISHEFRTPTNGILGITDILLESCSTNEDVKELRSYFEESRNRLLSVLDDSLFLAELELSEKKFETEPIFLNKLLPEVFAGTSGFAQKQGAKLGTIPDCEITVVGNGPLFKMAIETLVKTSVLFTSPGERTSVRLAEDLETVTVIIEGNGKCLREDEIAGFFDMSSSVRNGTYADELGLKPVLAERVITLYGGCVQIRNLNPAGIEIKIVMIKTLP
jgi:two-component system sensor histidine kinase/response regulator